MNLVAWHWILLRAIMSLIRWEYWCHSGEQQSNCDRTKAMYRVLLVATLTDWLKIRLI